MMNDTQIFERIAGYLSEQFAIPAVRISLETTFVGDLNADSLRLIEMAMHVEESMGVRIDDEDVRSLESVGDVVRYVAARLAAADKGAASAVG